MSQRKELTFGAGLWMFGQFVDRYATDCYGPSVGVLEAIDRAGAVGDLVALDINYPFDPGVTVEQIAEALKRNKLRCHAITPANPPTRGRTEGPHVAVTSRSRACFSLRDARLSSMSEFAAARLASGFRCRSCGITIVSKNPASRSAKCLYIVRWRGSTP